MLEKRIIFWINIGIILIFLTFLFFTKSILFTHNVHDVFIPLNSAHFVDQKVKLHQDVHTSFGWIYFAINYLGLKITDALPNIFGLNKIPSLASLTFFGVIAIIGAIIRVFTGIKIPAWFVILLVAICLTPLNFLCFDVNAIFWYGGYNNNLWALTLLHLYITFELIKRTEEGKDFSTKESVVIILVQFLLLYITLNYKINFFLSASGLTFAFLWNLGRRSRSLAFTGFGIILLLLVAATIITGSFGYSYLNYLSDIQESLNLKVEKDNLTLKIVYSLCLLGFGIIFILNKPQWTERKFNFDIHHIIIALSITAAIAFGIIGDFAKPQIYIFCTLFLCLLTYSTQSDVFFRKISIYFFLGLTIFSTCPIVTVIAKDIHYDKNEYARIELKTNRDNKTLDLIAVFNKARYYHNYYYHYLFFRDLNNIIELDSLIRISTSNYLVYSSTTAYLEQLNHSAELINSLNISHNDKIFWLGFVNAPIFLLNSAVPKNSYHWLHMGTTISKDDLYKLDPAIQESDIVILPVIGKNGSDDTMINCYFYKQNFRNDFPYQILAFDRDMIYFAKESWMKQRGYSVVHDIRKMKQEIEENCKFIEDNSLEIISQIEDQRKKRVNFKEFRYEVL